MAPSPLSPDSAGSPGRARSLERSLRRYRALTLLFGLAAAALAAALLLGRSGREPGAGAGDAAGEQAAPASAAASAPEASGEVGVIAVGELFREIERTRSHVTDASQNFFHSETAHVHLHAMGFGQTTPLHVHPESHEATILVEGAARVTHVYGRDGRAVERSGSHAPGSLLYSPPLSGHEWFNPSQDSMLGNLVIGVPGFAGNLYVKPDDPRLLAGGAPFAFDARAELERFLASGEPHRLEVLPPLEGRLSALFVARRFPVRPDPRGPLLGYVVSGSGRAVGRAEHRIEPQQLVLFDRRARVVLHADRASPLALYLFEPVPVPHAASAPR